MKKIVFSLFALFLVCNTLMAQEAKQLKVYKNGEVTHEIALSDIDSLIFSPIKVSDSKKTHILTLKKTTGGTVTASWTAAVGLAAGSKTSSTSADVTANVPHGATVTITNTPAEGYTFTSVSPANSFQMTATKTVSAVFTKAAVTKTIYIGNETQEQFDNMSANSIEEQIITESLATLQSRADEVVTFDDTVTTKEIEYTNPSDKCSVYVLVPNGYVLETWYTDQFGNWAAMEPKEDAGIHTHAYGEYTMWFYESNVGGVPDFKAGSVVWKLKIVKS